MVNEGCDSYIGKQIKSYTILQKLGSGGFACVYLARNELNELVAIKLLDAKYNTPERHQLFLREARFLQELKHNRYILPILEYGESKDTPYIVVEYTPGGTLRERINNYHPLAIEDALTILMQVGEAIHVAHQNRIVHSDVKPENILFNDKGDAILADFGIAVQLEGKNGYFGLPRGTYAYMAPEQFDGMFAKEGDQYSLGCIAYELLTGRHPFEYCSPFNPYDRRIMKERHKNAKVRPLRELKNAIPHHIEQAILQSLAKKPPKRHSSIAAFIRSLQPSTGLVSPSKNHFMRPLDTPAPYMSSSEEELLPINPPPNPEASSIAVEAYEIVQLKAASNRDLQNPRQEHPPGHILPENSYYDKRNDGQVHRKPNLHTEPPTSASQNNAAKKPRISPPHNPLVVYDLQLPGKLKALLSPSLESLELTLYQETVEDNIHSKIWKYTGIARKSKYPTAKNNLVPVPNYALIYIPAEFFNENAIFTIFSLFSRLTLILFSDELGDPDLVVEKRLEERGKARKITWILLRKKHIDDLKSKKPAERRLAIHDYLKLKNLHANLSVANPEVEKERNALKERLGIWNDNLRVLEKQSAQHGSNVPVSLYNDLENAKSEIARLQKRLANLPKQP